LLVAAGNDTTRYSIAASLFALANRPQLMEQLRNGGPAIWETAPDEFIRWASPTMHFRRTATREFELHGKTVKEGDKVILWFVSGNRDEEAFADPFEIDVARTPNRHIAFGQGGPHVCLGMWLARLEVRILLQEFVKRVKVLEQAGPHEFLRSNFIGGIKRLPVRVTLQ
jgi:cytochrome P450